MYLTIQDCLDMSELSEAEVHAIAEHENLAEVVAAELGNYLVHSPSGERQIRSMIADDLRAAEAEGKTARVAQLKLVLKHFVETHPQLAT
jgi:uncharacterized hydantoinase/oxoprolinase family protein